MTHPARDSLAELERLRAENARLITLLKANGIAWGLQEPASAHSVAAEPEPSQLTTEEKIAVFRRLFRGRTDAYPIRWESKAGRSGYSPACANEWRAGVCGKPRIKCSDCDNRHVGQTPTRVSSHGLSNQRWSNMTTLRLFQSRTQHVHPTAAWYLSDLGEFRGKQELYTRQSPQRLKALREHAIVESAVSSNRIEGVSVDPARVRDILGAPKPLFRDRDEEEVRGYRDALAWIHNEASGVPIDEDSIKRLHALTRGQIWDAGQYKDKDGDIIERDPNGQERVRFSTVPAAATPARMGDLMRDWRHCLEEGWVHPLIALAAFNLDFLCIHPFRDGNGRVSRPLWLLQSYQLGYEVGRYISLERLVEQNKARYYETLEQSSIEWHEGKHDPWPYINYVLFILKTAYREFAERVGEVKAPRGAKTDQVLAAIGKFVGDFTVAQLEHHCPGVSRDMIRRVLRERQAEGAVECKGRGPAAKWRKKG